MLRDCLDAGGPTPTVLTLSGGGSASDVWCQCIADVTGVPTVRVEGSEIGARGAMLHAAVAAGIVDSLPAAADAFVARAATFDPDPATRGLFDDRYADFRTTRDALADALERLGPGLRRLVSAADGADAAWVGIDLGTQSVRVVALDDAGHQLALAAEPLTSVRSGGPARAGPRAVVERDAYGAGPGHARLWGVRAHGARAGRSPARRARWCRWIRCTGQPRGMATMYDDRRGAPQLNRVAERGAELFARLGYRMQASWALPRMLTMVAEGLPDGRRAGPPARRHQRSAGRAAATLGPELGPEVGRGSGRGGLAGGAAGRAGSADRPG